MRAFERIPLHDHADRNSGGKIDANAGTTVVTSGSTGASELGAHVAADDPHLGYVREADANWIDLTDSGATTLHSHASTQSHILLADGRSTPFSFNDLLQMDDGSDFMWSDS